MTLITDLKLRKGLLEIIMIKKYNRSPAVWRGDLEEKLGYDRMEWRKRIVALSAFISDEDKSVIDLGAGNMYLRRILNEDVRYYPVDYKKNAEDTIVCDFNKKQFPNICADVIFAADILNYIEEPEWFLDEISKHCKKLLISYKGHEKYEYAQLYTNDIISFLNSKGFGIIGQNFELEEWTLLACFEKITPEKLCKQLGCMGCGCCVNICPTDAIIMDYDSDGYLKPQVDLEKCVRCGKCSKSCPALHLPLNENKFNEPKCYAAWANDDVRVSSSSGGFFSVLSRYVIDKGGSVFGAVWETGFYIGMHRADLYEDILPMRYSKYAQANTHRTFSEVRDILKTGRMVAYFGSPCQIAGLKSFLLNSEMGSWNEDNLIMVDFICFCAPSNVYFRKYLDENYGIDNVQTVNFRDKTSGLGWSPVGYKIELKSGETFYPKYEDDRYQKAFHEVLVRNYTCENCTYYRMPRQGDFSIGDFWGIDRHDLSWNDGRGTSLVLANNKKAKSILVELKEYFLRIENVPLSYALNKGNKVDDSARQGHKNRKYFCDMLSNMPFNEAVDAALSCRHDIGMVCFNNLNIGNNLTNYALYQTMTDMGYRILVIGNPIDRNLYNGKDERFTRFLKIPYKMYDIAPISFDKTDLYTYNDICDAFVVGSDQLFRAMFVEETDYFPLLDWAFGFRYKISYGTSFGCSEFEGSYKMCSKMSYLLKRFQRVSVREKSSVSLLKNIFNCDGECVLDPVFLCDKKYYLEMVKNGRMRLPEQSFVGAYFLDINEEKKNVLGYVSNEMTNGNYLVINDYPENYVGDDIKILHDVAIEEWVAMIADSDFFITDSFHGICFAIIFEKQFAVVFDEINWRGYERIKDILKRFGLENRLTNSKELQNILNHPVDYKNVNEILSKEKARSYAWLRKSLDECMDFKGSYDSQDMVIEQKLEDKKIKQELQEHRHLSKKIRSDLFIMGRSEIKRNNFKENGMDVIGFGAGECFKRNRRNIKEIYDLKYVCDNSPEKWGKDLGDGIVCISPKQLSEMNDVLVVIMVDSVKVSFEIADELMRMGLMKFTHIENWMDFSS